MIIFTIHWFNLNLMVHTPKLLSIQQQEDMKEDGFIHIFNIFHGENKYISHLLHIKQSI